MPATVRYLTFHFAPPDTSPEFPPERDCRRHPPESRSTAVDPLLLGTGNDHPCLRSTRHSFRNASRRPPSRRFKPLGVAPMSPLPGFPRSSRTLFAKELHERSHQRFRPLSPLLVRPDPMGLPKEPAESDAKGASCRRVQSTFFSFQRRATTSRATTGFACEPKPDNSPVDCSVHAEHPALAGQPPNT